MNKKIIGIITGSILIAVIILGISTMNFESSNESAGTLTMKKIVDSYYKDHTVKVNSETDVSIYITQEDAKRIQEKQPAPLNGIKFDIQKNSKIYEKLKPKDNEKSVVIYPIFTSAAYKEPGFYTFYRGECDKKCLTMNFENPQLIYTSSGMTAQILFNLGYEFLTDIDVDKNPDILKNYDKVIVLHSEYVTKNEFEAISQHPNVIFMFPNALYAEVTVDYNSNTVTLVKGHDYPEKGIANAFGYKVEEDFHKFEYDQKCENWEYVKISNGHHLNCYPDAIIMNKLEIIESLKGL